MPEYLCPLDCGRDIGIARGLGNTSEIIEYTLKQHNSAVVRIRLFVPNLHRLPVIRIDGENLLHDVHQMEVLLLRPILTAGLRLWRHGLSVRCAGYVDLPLEKFVKRGEGLFLNFSTNLHI